MLYQHVQHSFLILVHLRVLVPELQQCKNPVKLCIFTMVSSVGVPMPQKKPPRQIQIGVKDIKVHFLLFCCSVGHTCGGCVCGVLSARGCSHCIGRSSQVIARTCVFVHLLFDYKKCVVANTVCLSDCV